VRSDSLRVFFRTGQSKFDPSFKNNGETINAFVQLMRESQADPSLEVEVEQVIINSSSSPEGSPAVNERLSRERQQSIMDYLNARLKVAQPDAERSSHVIDWEMLRSLVQEDTAMPQAYRDNVLEKLDSADPLTINELKGSPSWKYLMDNIFPKMRTTLVVFVWEAWKELEFPELSYDDPVEDPFVYPEFARLDDHYSVKAAEKRPSTRDIILKVNMLVLPALVANAAIEIQPLPHFSISVPVYYSGINWFSEKVKFRVLGIQPELRYWLRKDMHGLFFNAHATFGWYNVALGGDYRYQDHAQKSPTFGGGVGVGYKVTLGRNNDSRWGLEMGIGGGVLPLHYDMYYNMHNGRLAGEDRHTYWGVDQAFISLTYRLGRAKFQQK
jgi:hypothetical protein